MISLTIQIAVAALCLTSFCTGYYMLFSASYLNPGTTAGLVSVAYPITSTECVLVFYYHMAGIDMGKLSVQVQSDENDQQFEDVWTMEGHQSNKWIRAEVNIKTKYSCRQLMYNVPSSTPVVLPLIHYVPLRCP